MSSETGERDCLIAQAILLVCAGDEPHFLCGSFEDPLHAGHDLRPKMPGASLRGSETSL